MLRDFGLLDSAVQRPLQTVFGEDAYPTIFEKAAALFHSLVRNHAFVDGNKRTAVLSMLVFFRLNGYSIEVDQGDLIGLAVDTAEGMVDIAYIAERFKQWAQEEEVN